MIPLHSIFLAFMVCTVTSAFVVVPRSSAAELLTSTSANRFSHRVFPHLLLSQSSPIATVRQMAVTDETPSNESSSPTKLPFFLDPGTKGGALVLMVVLFAVPFTGYRFMVSILGYDEIQAGITVGMGFTVFSTLAWMSTYLFRVATKDMTYVSGT